MNLYLVTQDENNGWDTYDSLVVAAPDEDSARKVHPSSSNENWYKEKDDWSSWASSLKNVEVRLIGRAADNITETQVIIASFNAG